MPDIKGTTLDGIRYETVKSPSFAALICHLEQGQSIVAEKGAMMYMHRSVEMKTHSRGGLMKSLKASVLGGESFFINTFTATHGNGDICFVGPTIGDIKPLEVQTHGWVIQKTGYMASSKGVEMDSKWQGLKGFFGEGSLFMLHASGQGTCFVSSFGGIIQKDLQAGEVVTVDDGHLVAFPDNINYDIRTVGGVKSTLLSGEGLVVDFTGPGTIFMQTRHLPAFAQVMAQYISSQR